MSNTLNVSGTDGISPIYQPEARWCTWSMDEVYFGQQGLNKFVPKVNDYVEDTASNVTYKVTSIDSVTLIPTLVQISTDGNIIPGDDDPLVSSGPGVPSDTYRVYLDKSVTPYTFSVDMGLKIPGSMSSYAKIFKGTNTGQDGQVLSFLYDQAGNFLTNNVPLELAQSSNDVNHTIKSVAVCYTNQELVNGEIVTLVIYSSSGGVVYKRRLIVENTTFIRSVSSSQKYISHISLKSPFLSVSEDHVLDYPLNANISSLNMIGVVHYSDGSTIELPVDGTKFVMHGLQSYVSTVPGQRINLALTYNLSPDETAYGPMTVAYFINTVTQQGAYTVKLYPYPVWVDSVNGYRLRWFMLNLDRNVFTEVTNLVTFNNPNTFFDPLSYGTLQRLSVRINLKDVSGSYKSYIHTQIVDVVLRNQGTERTTNWTVSTNPGQTQPYGVGIHAQGKVINSNLGNLKLSSGFTNLNDWLTGVYFNTKPLTDVRLEAVAPTPTHFSVIVAGIPYEFPITAWNDVLAVGGGIVVNSTLIVKFIKRTGITDMVLSVAGMAIYELP